MASPSILGAEMRFLCPPPEAAGDECHLCYWKLLDAALASNQDRYGNYTLVAYHKPLTFQRAAAEVESGNGRVNVVSRATNLALERLLRPIRIALGKGLFGARLFLVMPETQVRLEKVRTLDDLKQFSIGQGSSWTDLRILESSGFNLVLSDSYSLLFAMLGAGRFDMFSRGAIEIVSELQKNQKSVPDMVIEKRFMLYYPMPRYFFVPRTVEGGTHG